LRRTGPGEKREFRTKLNLLISVVGVEALRMAKGLRIFSTILLIILISCLLAASANANRTIYGVDDRREIYQEPNDGIRNLASSVAAMISRDLLSETKEGNFKIIAKTYQEEFQLCEGERFLHQPSAADCTAFLVAPDRLVTAGHCMLSRKDCKDYRFIFDYEYKTASADPNEVPKENVYSCKKILKTMSSETELVPDFAIVKLDRPVVGRLPLKTRATGDLQLGAALFMIGSPEGLPLKISGGANVRSLEKYEFTANLDAFGGNSGSPVFNSKTFEVEGILVTGDEDFVTLPASKCYVSYVCPNAGCKGEGVTPIRFAK
jgi:hypothetical protein